MKTIQAKILPDRPITDAVLDEAMERGTIRHRNSLQATEVSFQGRCLTVSFEDGTGVLLPVGLFSEFDHFDAEDYAHLKVGLSGTALCHEARDLHVSIAGMISASKPLMNMATSVVSSRNGRQSTAAKAEAARVNGKKGGRPRRIEMT